MGLLTARLARSLLGRSHPHRADRDAPERIVLGVAPGVEPSGRPPVRIFIGTEPAQRRAERVLVWSIERHRDPSRVYEIYLMRELAGFRDRFWLTGFTNYRFAIPELARRRGRAIYNDVDQIYLGDPAELFDAPMGEAGFLAIDERDSAVMLIDCERMARVWPIEDARRLDKNRLLRRGVEAGPFGRLAPEWHARDEEYEPGRSRLLHYTRLHGQPWLPFPELFVYQRHPHAEVWIDAEREADAAGYEIFRASRPSSRAAALLGGAATTGRTERRPPAATGTEPRRAVRAVLECALGAGRTEAGRALMRDLEAAGIAVRRVRPDLAFLSDAAGERFETVFCRDLIEHLSDLDRPWVLDALFARAGRRLLAAVRLTPSGPGADAQRRAEELFEVFDAAGRRHPEVAWELAVEGPGRFGRRRTWHRRGGPIPSGAPRVWVLTQGKAGHTAQAAGLASAIGWPYEVRRQLGLSSLWKDQWRAPRGEAGRTAEAEKRTAERAGGTPLERRRTGDGATVARGASRAGLGAALAPAENAWPDVVIAAGWLPAILARRVRHRSRGWTRAVLLGRKGSQILADQDIVVSCAHFHLPPHPRRIETLVPPHAVTLERLEQAHGRFAPRFAEMPRPLFGVLVGGPTTHHALDAATARGLAREVVGHVRERGGSVFVATSRRTPPEATAAIAAELGAEDVLYRFRPGDPDNPFLGILACADALVVTGESESMLGEAAFTAKPLYVFPLPEKPVGRLALRRRLGDAVLRRALATPRNRRGTVRPQQGLEYVCARLVQYGIFQPPRDLDALHRALIAGGYALPFLKPARGEGRPALRETERVAAAVKARLGLEAATE